MFKQTKNTASIRFIYPNRIPIRWGGVIEKYAISIQNEPNFLPDSYPGMKLSVDQQLDLTIDIQKLSKFLNLIFLKMDLEL